MMQAMRATLQAPDTRIEIVEYLRRAIPPGDFDFPMSGLMAPAAGRDTALWNGSVHYDGGRFPSWVRVRIAVREQAVVAVETLKPGQTIEAAGVKLDQVESFPRRRPMASQLEAVIGRVARRSIPAGSPIPPDALDEPLQVAKGDTVQVEVRSGAAVLRLEARAESAGRRGQTIAVRNTETGKIFRARVQDKGQLVMECLSGN
jgi:flagella basal body P-ring formation protein FlgA